MEPVLDRFDAFVTSERELYDREDANRVAFPLAQIGRYLDFVEIARTRHLSASRELAERLRKQMEGARVNNTHLARR